MAASDKPVEERVKAIIVEQLGVEENDVAPAAKFIEDLGADSLDTVELVMAFEEEFDIEIPGRGRREDHDGGVTRSSTSRRTPRPQAFEATTGGGRGDGSGWRQAHGSW